LGGDKSLPKVKGGSLGTPAFWTELFGNLFCIKLLNLFFQVVFNVNI